MEVTVEPKCGFIKYKSGTFTDIDKYFLYLITGDLKTIKEIPFYTPAAGDKKEISKMYFTVIMNYMRQKSKKYRNVLSDVELSTEMYIFPSVVLSLPDFSKIDPEIEVYTAENGFTYAIVYDAKSRRKLAIQPVHWNLIEKIDKKCFVDTFQVVWPIITEKTVEKLEKILSDVKNLSGEIVYDEKKNL